MTVAGDAKAVIPVTSADSASEVPVPAALVDMTFALIVVVAPADKQTGTSVAAVLVAVVPSDLGHKGSVDMAPVAAAVGGIAEVPGAESTADYDMASAVHAEAVPAGPAVEKKPGVLYVAAAASLADSTDVAALVGQLVQHLAG